MRLTLIGVVLVVTGAVFFGAIKLLPKTIDEQTLANAVSIAEMQQLSNQIAELETQVAAQTAQNTSLSAARDQLQAELTSAEATISTLTTESETLSEEKDVLRAHVSELQRDLTERNAVLVNHAQDAEDLKDRVSELEASLTNLKNEQQTPDRLVSDLETRLSVATTALEAANEQIQDLNARIAQEARARTIADLEIASLKDSVAAQHEVVTVAQEELAHLKSIKEIDSAESLADVTQTSADMSTPEPIVEETLALTPTHCSDRMQTILEAGNITFETGTATFDPDTRDLLQDLSAIVLECTKADLQVEIGAHTDNLGNESINLTLSKERANAVSEFFAATGVAIDAMQPIGFGESQPIAENNTTAGRAENRRITFVWQIR